MRNLLIIPFLIFIHHGFSQEKYYVDEYQYYELLDSVNFRYGQDGFCGSAPSGKGKYFKNKNNIHFYFSDTNNKPKIIASEFPLGNNTSEKFKIKIICMEDSINSFPFVNLFYIDSTNKKIGSYTDINGECEFNISKNNFRDTIFILYPGIPNFEIPVSPYNQIIKLILPVENPFEIHNETRIYRIGRKKKLILTEN